MIEWKQIPGFGGRYWASACGKIKSTFRGERILRPSSARGYGLVKLYVGHKIFVTQGVHRLVYMAYCGPIPENKEINHRDGNPSNNHINNLEAISHHANMLHAKDLGRIRLGHLKRRITNRKPVAAVDINGNIIKEFISLTEAAIYYKLHIGTIYSACQRTNMALGRRRIKNKVWFKYLNKESKNV